MRIRENRKRANLLGRFFVFVLAIGAFVALGIVVLLRLGTAARDLGPAANDLNPLEGFLLATYLSAHAADLTAPAGPDPAPVIVAVQPGASADDVSRQLAALGLVADARLLNFYLRYTGLDNHIEAGEFALDQTMTVKQIAAALTDARERQVVVRLIEGWRLEQMAEALSANPNLAVSRDEFLALAGPEAAHTGHTFSGDLPSGASLEGFLFPDTYLFRPGAADSDVIQTLLNNFEAHLPANYRDQATAHGLNLYQAVTLASLIEREAVVDDERPLIASVIYNRLIIGQPLEIDASVQYAIATPADWWPGVAGLDFRAIASPYNTYYVAGLPAGPIANPGLASLLAAVNPAETDYLYYRAQCDGSGRHNFAATYEEHLANDCP